jgi:hypothetical protein
MATLGSPGVLVTVENESFYTPSAPGTIPLIFVATAQDKSNASLTGTAQGTTAANAGKVWVITSQRDLTDTFGTPKFYTDVNGNSVHGGELNEYGLQAAYSLLGVSSRAYVARANVDLAALTPSTSVPEGGPVSGTYWVDTDATLYGVNEWDSTTLKFTVKTPLIIDNDNVATAADGDLIPVVGALGEFPGDYAMVVTSDNMNQLWYRTATTWVKVENGFDTTNKWVTIAPHTSYPNWGSGIETGSVWIKTTTPGKGANWAVKLYSGSTKTWSTVSAPVYATTQEAVQKLDATGGSKIAVGSLFVQSDIDGTEGASFKLYRRANAGATTVVSPATTGQATAGSTFQISETTAGSSGWTNSGVLTLSTGTTTAQAIASAINASALDNITASYDTVTEKLTISHRLGGEILLTDGTNAPLDAVGITSDLANVYDSGSDLLVSNWKPLVYEAKKSAPYTLPADGKVWYDARFTDVDIMYHNGSSWEGYVNAFPNTDPAGPIVAATAPTEQSDGTALVANDIWVSTANTDRYGKDIYIWNAVSMAWDLQDVTDQTTPNGWVFADARWGNAGSVGPATVTPITTLLASDFVDVDSPDPALYPRGTRLWNTRRSGFNVKKYSAGHVDVNADNTMYGDEAMTGYSADRWVTISANNEDGSGTFGRLAQRAYIVAKLKAEIDTNDAVRDTDTLAFNLMATPGYPETIANMVALNNDRGLTAFVVGDTPFRLAPTATALQNWGTNAAGATDNGDAGLVTKNEYLGMFYPSGFTTDNSGKNIVVPPSHMMLRTIANSDAKSYQWFAPAGIRRGGVDNATSVGYLTAEGEFKTVALYESLRNVLQDPVTKVAINPIATLPGSGIVNFGQQTRASAASALDRINVARLVAYLRKQLSVLAKPYLFEPNDAQTRREIKGAVESLLIELVGQRALYDFIVQCDSQNNTPARIDRSELWVDIAVEPVKAVEFIYIPLRIKNSGDIAAGI